MPRLPMYDRQVMTQGLGAGPVNLPETTTDQQFLGAGADAAARATESITRQENDTAMQGAALGLDMIKYSVLKQVREKQGAAALNSSNQALSLFNQETSKLSAKIPLSRKDEWDRLRMATQLQLQSISDAHELDEMKRYHQGQFQGRLDIGVADAQAYWNEPLLYNTAVEKVDNAINSYSAANGWSPEQTAAARYEMQQKMAMSATQANIAERTKSMMNADGTLNAYDGTIDTEQLATAAFYQESRLSQFDANGKPLTSPKGAVGIAQVMKKTGPEAAEAAGLKWDEDAWRNDPAYNLALGKAYLNKQLKAFGGNQVLALAAYNAGAGMVNDWIHGTNKTGKNKNFLKIGDPRTGEITNEDFARSIPFGETQNYVAKIMESVPSVPKTATMAAITDTPYFNQLSPQDQSRALSGMAEILNKQRQASRVVLDGIVNDASAALRNGQQPQVIPSRNQLISSYGLVQGGQIFTRLQNDEAFGNNVRLVKNIPPAQQQQLLEQAKPEPGPNYAERRKNYDQLSTAINAVNTARTADPIAFGMREGMVSSLDFTNAETLTQTLKSRYSQAVQLSGNYGTPLSLLTKQEASQLASMVKGADPDVAINFLKSAGSVMGPDGLRALSVQVAPNSASTAYASIILGAPDNQYNNRSGVISYDQFIGYKPTIDKYEVTKTILLGDQLINPTSIQKKAGMQAVALPSDDKLRQEFDDAVGTAFQYNPQARQMAYSVFKSAYAGLAYTSKDTDDLSTKSVNSDLAEKAVKYATGGVYQDFNGGDVVMPFGMDKSTFKDRYNGAARDTFSGAGLNPGAVGNFRPVNVGDNQYRLVAGSGRWAVDPRTGNPIIVRVQ